MVAADSNIDLDYRGGRLLDWRDSGHVPNAWLPRQPDTDGNRNRSRIAHAAANRNAATNGHGDTRANNYRRASDCFHGHSESDADQHRNGYANPNGYIHTDCNGF